VSDVAFYSLMGIAAVVIAALLRVGIQAAIAEWREEKRLAFNRKVEAATQAWYDREIQRWKDSREQP